MSVNTEIWGAPETWATLAGDVFSKPDIRLPVFGNSSTYKYPMAGAYDEGVFEWNGEPIDMSFAPWGIGKSSAIANSQFVYIGTELGNSWDSIAAVNCYTRPIYDEPENDSIPFLPTCKLYSNSSTYLRPSPSEQYSPNAGDYSRNIVQTAPIMSFKYNNIIVLPWIMCCKEDPDSAKGYAFATCSVDDYFNTYQSEYPYISSVYIKGFYCGNKPNVDTGRSFDNSDFRNSRATFGHFYGEMTKKQTASWDGYPTKFNDSFYSCISSMYMVICGMSPTSADPLVFSLKRNEEYREDNAAFARWSYAELSYLHGIRGAMFDFDYKYNNGGILYLTPRWGGATKADVLREVAYLGYWFTTDEEKAKYAAIGRYCTDSEVYMPVFDAYGVTTGQYKSGTEAAAIAPADEATPADFIDYDPYIKGAFQDADKLEHVTIPISVKTIGAKAFSGTALQRVKIAADCTYDETSFPEGCVIERYPDDRYGQLYDSAGKAVLDYDARRVYVLKEDTNNG